MSSIERERDAAILGRVPPGSVLAILDAQDHWTEWAVQIQARDFFC